MTGDLEKSYSMNKTLCDGCLEFTKYSGEYVLTNSEKIGLCKSACFYAGKMKEIADQLNDEDKNIESAKYIKKSEEKLEYYKNMKIKTK